MRKNSNYRKWTQEISYILWSQQLIQQFFQEWICPNLGEFTTPDMPSLDFFNLSLNDSIAQIFFFFLEHEGSCKCRCNCTTKDQKSRILPSSIVSNECLHQVLNSGQTWIGTPLEYLNLQHLHFSFSTYEHHVSTWYKLTLKYVKYTPKH